MLTLAQRQCNGNRHDNPTGWKCTCGGGQAYHNNATPTNNASNPEGTPFDGWRPNRPNPYIRSSSASAPNPHPIGTVAFYRSLGNPNPESQLLSNNFSNPTPYKELSTTHPTLYHELIAKLDEVAVNPQFRTHSLGPIKNQCDLVILQSNMRKPAVTSPAFGIGSYVTGEASNNTAAFDGWKKG